MSFWPLSLIDLPNNIETEAVPDHAPKAPRPDENPIRVDAPADRGKQSWKSTASATAKLLLRGVNNSADAFGPLKSVVGGLCFILDHCEVCFISRLHYIQDLQLPQRTKANRQAIESLAPRIEELAKLLSAPVPENDTNEKERRNKLGRWVHSLYHQELSLTWKLLGNCKMFINT